MHYCSWVYCEDVTIFADKVSNVEFYEFKYSDLICPSYIDETNWVNQIRGSEVFSVVWADTRTIEIKRVLAGTLSEKLQFRCCTSKTFKAFQ